MHIHFIGIGGIGMSGLAFICLKRGHEVSGSDSKSSAITASLERSGAKIYIGQKSENIQEGTDIAVYTAAVSPDNEELVEARSLGIETMDRAEFLGLLMKDFSNCIAIAGTHGKTSTTSMTSVVFNMNNLDPTILVGGNLPHIGGNVRVGGSMHFITEACEYVDSFLKFHPTIAIITNIDADHLDYFRDIDHIKDSFAKFAALVPEGGHVIVNGDDENISDMLAENSLKIRGEIISYGFDKSNNAVISDLEFDNNGCASFLLSLRGSILGKFSLGVPGVHNVLNSCAAIITSYVCGIAPDDINSAIGVYSGVGRRFEHMGSIGGIKFIDDYAHHPTEITATLSAARRATQGKIWCIFQPHTYTRTKLLLEEFSNAFDDADNIIITDIYAAREIDNGEIHSTDLFKRLSDRNKNVNYISSFEEIASYVLEHASEGDIVITMGAGDINRINDIIFKDK
ncbi:UDP-N-acetylmuramate--L-alanine ligase MurC [Peptoclostridium acidaminophilum DSM 3953]|uniref:UDP-N-acetylmuramate--L-alanine ligase n=1 Tax=Peptoclostridium acidaminophilum DSM 3953 TaxID=1286171 RepID=W8U3H8_PEPAC|nr:UDP-N-acetylmuramate--L-alanine ligase [Peptoclostridium acidaminophilum]AHM55541.1 UDP-N-acetylmuramate--L-alanine ligase MurC [Peptoclostridium acidaminophilum DSM 3953]